MVELGHGYLRTAIKDLKAAKTLYRYSLYPQAVFYFAQSVEKANKSLALVNSNFTEDYLANKVRHDSTKLYKNIIVEQKKQDSEMLNHLEKYPELGNFSVIEKETINGRIMASEDILREIARIKKEKDDLDYLSTRELNNLLKMVYSELQEIEKENSEILSTEIDIESWLQEIDSTIERMRTDNTEFSNYLAEELEKLKESNFEDLGQMIKTLLLLVAQGYLALIPLYYLTPIVLPHVNSTRYPGKGTSPVEIYNINMPLVKKLPELFDLHSNTLKNLKLFRDKI
ncbi:MAG: HEPN domain-containing protein [Nanoarchaeota archaeon]